MWINFKIEPSEEESIYLPETMKLSTETAVQVHFGKKFSLAKIKYDGNLSINSDNSFYKPATIKISSALRELLFIPTSLTYQVKLSKNEIIIGPVIGFLLGCHSHLYSPKHMRKYSDRFGEYAKIGGLVVAFSEKTIDWENKKVYGLYYNNFSDIWEYGEFPMPMVIYRRNFHTEEKVIKKLIELTDCKLFNSYRFNKYEMQEYISKNNLLSKHLIPTKLSLNFTTVKGFIDNYNGAILKPIDLSRGRGICIISKEENLYKVKDYRSKNKTPNLLFNDVELKKFFSENTDFFVDYLIQKHLNLAKVNGSVYDIRVVMQKDFNRTWKVSGIECRIAPSKSLITNISKGGYALSLLDALKNSFPNYAKQSYLAYQVDEFCKELCMYMDTMGHHFAEFGIDVAFDEDMHLWLIEINVFPSFKGFKIMDYNTYLSIRYTPMLYAASLADFKDYL